MSTVIHPKPATARPHLKTPPGPRGNLLFGSMFDFQKDPLGLFMSLAREYGDVVRYRVAVWTFYLVNRPEGIQRILQENNRNYVRGATFEPIRNLARGNGLATSEGEFWLRQRRLMQPVFHRQRVAAFGDLMTEATLAMLERWRPIAADGRPLDTHVEMTRLTMGIVTQALFSAKVTDETIAIGQAITTIMGNIEFRYAVPFYPSVSVPTPRNRRHLAALRTLDQIVYGILRERRRHPRPADGSGDLLSLLIEARDEETGEGMSDKQLRDEVLTLFVAGHESTANALTWVFYLLSRHPEVERRLRAELAEVLGGRVPTVADLSELSYTRMVIEETLRLYPPAWIMIRSAVADDEICGYRIPANATVLISPYVIHRLPTFWEAPAEFDPERFTPERSADRPDFAYFPFGGGPHQCIGKGYALQAAQLVLATVAQRFRLRLAPGQAVEPQALLTLRPRGSLPMTAHPV